MLSMCNIIFRSRQEISRNDNVRHGCDFGQNFGIWPPGVPIYIYIYIYGCLLLVCHLNTTKPSPKCIFWYFCIIKWTKLGGYLHNTNIWVISGQNSDFWPPGVLICIVTPYCFAIYFEEIVSCFALNAIFLYLVLSKDPKLHYTDISAFFSKFRCLTPPQGDISGVTPWGVHNFLCIPSHNLRITLV